MCKKAKELGWIFKVPAFLLAIYGLFELVYYFIPDNKSLTISKPVYSKVDRAPDASRNFYKYEIAFENTGWSAIDTGDGSITFRVCAANPRASEQKPFVRIISNDPVGNGVNINSKSDNLLQLSLSNFTRSSQGSIRGEFTTSLGDVDQMFLASPSHKYIVFDQLQNVNTDYCYPDD